jgi:NADH-quinone oxidoreductase subunit N
LRAAIAVIAALSMLAGNWLALMQGSAKRMLAYSSIAHMGYLMIPLFLPYPANQTPLLFYLTAYVLSAVGSFGVIGVLSTPERERESMEEFHGLAGEMPAVAVAFVIVLISLAGIPLTMGFMGKLFLFNSIVGSPAGTTPVWTRWMLAASLASGSVIGLFYYLRLVSLQLSRRAGGETRREGRIPSVPEGIAFVIIVMVLIGLGVYPAPFLELIRILAQPAI